MKRTALLLCSVIAIILVSGCVNWSNCEMGSGDVVSEDFTVSKFHSINLGGSGNIYITQDPEQALRIEAEDNILELMTVNVANGKLNIGTRRCYTSTKPVNIYVSMEDVRDLTISGSGKMVGQTEINSDSLGLNIIGSGSYDMDIDANELNTRIDGSGKFNLRGSAKIHNGKTSGSGSILAFDLSTEKTDISIFGSGKAEVNASQELDITIEGSGSVFYTGDATVSQTISGSGRIQKV